MGEMGKAIEEVEREKRDRSEMGGVKRDQGETAGSGQEEGEAEEGKQGKKGIDVLARCRERRESRWRDLGGRRERSERIERRRAGGGCRTIE